MARKSTTKSAYQSSRSIGSLLVAYYATVACFLLAWLIPETRVWGFNWWAYQPDIVQILLVTVALGTPPLLWALGSRLDRQDGILNSKGTGGGYWIAAFLVFAVLAVSYYVFPSTTHFLGDGYELISRIATAAPAIKPWDIGASKVADLVSGAVGTTSQENARLTFRIIASASGVLFLAVVFFAAGRLFEHRWERLLFVFGLSSGGYALQFFGYVENYALLWVMVTAFTLFGLLAAHGNMPRWPVIIPAVLACALHIFGVVLLPSLIYLLLHDRAPFVRLASLNRKNKVLLTGALAVIAVALYFFLFYNYYFFRFAFLPLWPDQFTVDGDFLLSLKHAADLVNLHVLLVPGIALLAVELLSTRRQQRWGHLSSRFLLTLLGSALLLVYLFNPGFGMPRNWDLFSLPGVPLAVLMYYTLLKAEETRRRLVAAGLAAVLGFLVLIPRVVSQQTPAIAIAHFKNYVELDPNRNRNARSLLTDYYRSIGDTVSAEQWVRQTQIDFPESDITNRGKQALASGNIRQAESLFRQALKINPIFVDAYSNLATCFLSRGEADSALAYLELADGLNPLNASVANNKGTVYLRRDELDKAEAAFHEALRLEPDRVSAVAGLVSVSLKRKNDSAAHAYLTQLVDSPDLPVTYFQSGVEACLEAGLTKSARLAYRCAVARGADIAWQQATLSMYPSLAQ